MGVVNNFEAKRVTNFVEIKAKNLLINKITLGILND
jgi:hypothetical protein